MRNQTHHVVHDRSSGTWNVKRSGSSKSSGYYSTKKEAVEAARRISKNQKTELIIHGLNGKIQSCDSHGNDPCPPKDKN